MTSFNSCSVIQFFIYLIGVRSRDHLRANQIAPGRNHVTRPASHATTLNSTLQANGAKAGANWEPSVYLHGFEQRKLVVV